MRLSLRWWRYVLGDTGDKVSLLFYSSSCLPPLEWSLTVKCDLKRTVSFYCCVTVSTQVTWCLSRCLLSYVLHVVATAQCLIAFSPPGWPPSHSGHPSKSGCLPAPRARSGWLGMRFLSPRASLRQGWHPQSNQLTNKSSHFRNGENWFVSPSTTGTFIILTCSLTTILICRQCELLYLMQWCIIVFGVINNSSVITGITYCKLQTARMPNVILSWTNSSE